MDYEDTENLYQFGYIVKTNEKNYSNCLFSAGLFRLEYKIIEENKGIVLNYNNSIPFIFEKNYYNSVLFLYLFGSNYSNFSININTRKNNKYNIEFYINYKNINKNIQINAAKQILIKNDDWKAICDDIKQPCLLSILIKPENHEESKIDILVSSFDYKQEREEDEDDNDNFPIWLIIIIVLACIIFIIGIIFLILKCRNKNSNKDIENLNIEQETRPLM